MFGARGVTADLQPAPIIGGHVAPVIAARSPEQPTSFRCRIIRGGHASGSGVLFGPSTVLTAWHVIAPATAFQPDAAIENVEVLLAEGQRYAAIIAASPYSACEVSAQVPANDDAVADLHDMALMKLAASGHISVILRSRSGRCRRTAAGRSCRSISREGTTVMSQSKSFRSPGSAGSEPGYTDINM